MITVLISTRIWSPAKQASISLYELIVVISFMLNAFDCSTFKVNIISREWPLLYSRATFPVMQVNKSVTKLGKQLMKLVNLDRLSPVCTTLFSAHSSTISQRCPVLNTLLSKHFNKKLSRSRYQFAKLDLSHLSYGYRCWLLVKNLFTKREKRRLSDSSSCTKSWLNPSWWHLLVFNGAHAVCHLTRILLF